MNGMKLVFVTLSALGCVANLFGQIDFEKEVWPILQDRCVECHKAPYEENGRLKNPKAGLRLDGAAHIMHGSDDGRVIAPNHPSKSALYGRIVLPADDDDVMPPKGDPLTKEQCEIFRKWIAQGVDFGIWEGATDGTEKFAEKKTKDVYLPAHFEFYDKLAKGLKPLPEKALDSVRQATGALIRPVGIGSPLLEVRFLAESVASGDDELKELVPLRQHLAKLDLGRTKVTSQSLSLLATFPRVTRLDLRNTEVSDAQLEELASLRNLIYLNLVGTQVSDAGLRKLAKCKSLQELYLWNSKASSRGINSLGKQLPQVKLRF
ncbi:MAG: c-type cytochrome domain-containing protein [Opitutales bacterium]